MTITWKSGKSQNSILLQPVCYMDYTIDQILRKILGEYNPNFIGMSDVSRFKLVVKPPERLTALLEATKVTGNL